MTTLHDGAAGYAADALSGFVAAHPRDVRAVRGGVVRASSTPPGQVAVVIGGGSGHHPAFAGWVGPGMAHGAACGNVFASPSAAQVCSVARAAGGSGVLLGFGNYAGDVLHFGLAAEQLRAEGIDARVLAVVDDVASAPPEQAGLRRGIAGDLLVFKLVGAAAERGMGLDDVERIGRRAVEVTRSLGVAFSGCTLPGAAAPLFEVPPGRMALGLGVHGEPGLSEHPLGSATEVADRLVDGVLAEPAAVRGGRVAVLLNGMGGIGGEELFVVYGRIARRLAGAGLEPVDPVVGAQMSSLGMSGLSLSVTPLDDELAELWADPVDTPAWRRGGFPARPARTDDLGDTGAPPVAAGSAESHRDAALVVTAFEIARDVLAEHEERLGRLDAVAGDGDHGLGMRRGSLAAAEAAETARAAGAGAGTVLARAAAAWSESAGGTSGALWGGAISAFGSTLGDQDAVTGPLLGTAIGRAVDAVARLGGAAPGDKTMVDAAAPFAELVARAGAAPAEALVRAAEAATTAAAATADIPARRGRARTHGDRSLGTPDPGATSFALVVTALTATLNTTPPGGIR
ncbi:dihydroxyacetone kinase family protein [Saccharopolyspora sp. NFXS83]|uniref:dihydroxyacetone kinase family protein n=1 Tax=Saccharopolyspora sp. NFXS83 TaxID=2993560 RepID=UPI00224B47F5|nr:dihydroxyacetone kinase family protein [Saccharopolyspora sp. NFXS83]MCX2730724.1 dihydroxyacetone kinase family protein [Saccharopolyspora sp. NFXS83]